MKKSFLIQLLLLFLSPLISKSQTWEVGLFGGVSNYQGDLAPSIILSESKPAIGILLRHNLSGYFALNYGLNYGSIEGNDKNFDYNAQRNLNFKSELVEGSFQVEFNFFKYNRGFSRGVKAKRFSPYIFTGISVFYFDPRTTIGDQNVSLRLMRTEGQGIIDNAPSEYGKYNVAIPIGFGFKYQLGQRWNMAVFGSYRTTFTDYLDDVSGNYVNKDLLAEKNGELAARLSDRSGEISGKYIGYTGRMRGNSSNTDYYLFAGLSISYVISDPNCPKKF